MISFKDFLYEAPRKPKVPPEPSWVDDHEAGLGALRDMQQYNTKKPDRFRLQLFVPKRRDPKILDQRKHDMWWRETGREVEAELKAKDLKEETTPILTSFTESPVQGDNKPSRAFWTSSAIKRKGGYTSEWYELVKNRFPEWQTDYGFLFEVKSQALVFESEYLDHFYDWSERTGRNTKEVSDWAKNYYGDTRMRTNYPWDTLAKHFDGVTHPYDRRSDEFTYGWDVESTAWFNTKMLTYKGAVKLDNYGDIEDDE